MTKLQIEVLNLLKEGYTPSQISKKLNRAMSSISSIIKRFNIKNYNTEYPKCNHNYFDTIDNEEKSYLLGFFIADGWIDKNRFGISIQEEDNYLLNYYQKFCNSKIYTKNRNNHKNSKNISTIRWTSLKMKETFKDYNIIQNKTYNTFFEFPFDKIDINNIRHFIRGFIDGDGSFESNKGTFTITLVNTSYNFMIQIGNIIEELDNGIEKNIKRIKGKTVDYYTLRFNFFRKNKPEKVLKIYNYLYKDSTIFLQRKKDKIESYLKYRGKL